MKSRVVLFTVIFLIFTLFLCFSDEEDRSIPSVSLGVLDLSDFNIEREKTIRLDGQWEFYWESFVTSDDFSQKKQSFQPEYVQIPGSWTKSLNHPAHGYASLRMSITGLSPETVYSLYIPDMFTSYTLWINGVEYSRNGHVSKNPHENKPQSLPKVVSFTLDEGAAEIIIHQSNFDYRISGIIRSCFFGTDEGIRMYREKSILSEVFLAGIFFAISLFHIGFFFYRKSEKRELYFGLLCLSVFIRMVTTGEQLLTYFIPGLSWEVIRKLEFIPFYAIAPLLILFLTSLFPRESSKLINRIYIGITSLIGVVIFIFPVRISNNIVPFSLLLMLIGLIYVSVIMISAMIHKRDSAGFMVLAYFIFSLTVVNDMLYSRCVIQTMYITPLGFVVFLIMQSQMLICKFSHYFSQRDSLQQSRDTFRHASITDSLTGLYNVRYLGEVLEKEMYKAEENNLSLSLIMGDVDNFKYFNDTWGHKLGDEVLKRIGAVLISSARDQDSPCRYGGEEFVLILPNTELGEAYDVSERIRLRLESIDTDTPALEGLTMSIGVAQFFYGESGDSLIDRADRALYKAKNNGKNRVELAE